MSDPVVLLVSIDTEEDNWEPTRAGITVENIRELPRLDRQLEQLGVRPTFFTTYYVATTSWSGEIIKSLASSGRVEIGAHLHPWNTPPLDGPLSLRETMLSNLSPKVQREKIQVLTDALVAVLGSAPESFRAGRWGLNASAAESLIACGYRVDSSVTPFRSWRSDFGPSHVGAPLDVYRIGGRDDHRKSAREGTLVEVPTSWGYTQRSWPLTQRINLGLDSQVCRSLGLLWLARRLHLINHVVLSPELDSVEDMVELAQRLLDHGVRHLHVTFHSTSLRAGLNPFCKSAADVERFYRVLSTVIERIGAMTPIRCATVGEAAAILAPPIQSASPLS